MKRALTILLLLAAVGLCRAQSGDIVVTGIVYNLHTKNPEPYCLVQLVQDSVAKAVRVCDDEGFFVVDSLPMGSYTLRVGVGSVTLYQNDFKLLESANLSIYVDTLQLINLRTVTINAHRRIPSMPGHNLGHELIVNTNDYRLWNFSGHMTDSGPACADLSRGENAGLHYQAEVAKKKSHQHLWYTAPIPATTRRKSSPTPVSRSTAVDK